MSNTFDVSAAKQPTIFLSYARADVEFASELYSRLSELGFDIWLDIKSLRPGQNWDFEIKIQLDKSDFVIVILSNNSVTKRGYFQREVRKAIDKLSERLIDDIFIIPVITGPDIQVPYALKDIQYISDSKAGFQMDIADAINHQIERAGGARVALQNDRDLFWSSRVKREAFDGIPGYEFEAQLLEFRSDTHSNIDEVGTIIRAEFLGELQRLRASKIVQNPEWHSFAKNKWSRTDTYDASCGDPIIHDNILSIRYAVHWYGAGAAHPNHHYVTYNFIIDPLILIKNLESIFSEPVVSLQILIDFVRKDLLSERFDDGESYRLDEETVNEGIKDWDSFPSFILGENSIELLFAPYQVAAYALGPQFVEVPYEIVAKYIERNYQIALGIEHLTRG